MPPNWMPTETEMAGMFLGGQRGIWCCWAYMNADGHIVKVWNRDATRSPLAHQHHPVWCIAIQMGNA